MRARAYVNQIVDTLVEGLDVIRTERETYCGPVPQYIGRVYDVDAADCDLPAVLLQVPEMNCDQAGATGAGFMHDAWLEVWANVVTENPAAPDHELHELMADVGSWMLDRASGLLVNRVKSTGEVLYTGFKSHVQIADLRGRAAARMFFRVWYKFSHRAL